MANYKVLVIDDDKPTRTLINIMLKRNNFDVALAENGADAFAQLENFTPDVIIVDYMLPDVNGIELCKQLRSRPDTSHLPILMLSAHSANIAAAEAKAAGANDYAPKPLLMDEIGEKLNKLIEETANTSEER